MTAQTTSDHVQTLFEGDNDWAYDNSAGKDRLTQEVYDQGAGNTIDYTSNFAYDAADNPTTFKGTSQSFNAANQRSATGYAYDGNGNPTTYAGGTLTYSVENRLKTIANGNKYFWAGYRADGLRAYKNTYEGTSPGDDPSNTRTYFYYDRGMPVLECDSSGNVTSVNVFADDGLVARKVGSVYRYYQFDPQGSVTHRLTSTETVSGSAKYDAYGKYLYVPGTVFDPYGWNGRWGYYNDTETGLILCMHRYYDADQGRWLNRDPIGYAGGVNLYAYCDNDPVGTIDPLGLWDIRRWIVTGDGNASDDVYDAGLVSLWDSWSSGQGRETGFAALGEAATFGVWKPKQEIRDRPGYETSVGLGNVAKYSLLGALGLKTAGVNVVCRTYPNSGGGGINFLFRGKPFFRFDIHKWGKGTPWWKWPHWHTRPGMKRHKPWQ